jgi:hypothetical protein
MRKHLTYANVAATLALVIAVAGGTAYAANTIGSSDVIDNSLQSVDVHNNNLRSVDVRNQSLTGVDVSPQSGVDSCTHGSDRFGELCVEVANVNLNWTDAGSHCANLELRLPSLGEARALAENHDLPDVADDEEFWTEETYVFDPLFINYLVDDAGVVSAEQQTSANETVCVTTPTN